MRCTVFVFHWCHRGVGLAVDDCVVQGFIRRAVPWSGEFLLFLIVEPRIWIWKRRCWLIAFRNFGFDIFLILMSLFGHIGIDLEAVWRENILSLLMIILKRYFPLQIRVISLEGLMDMRPISLDIVHGIDIWFLQWLSRRKELPEALIYWLAILIAVYDISLIIWWIHFYYLNFNMVVWLSKYFE